MREFVRQCESLLWVEVPFAMIVLVLLCAALVLLVALSWKSARVEAPPVMDEELLFVEEIVAAQRSAVCGGRPAHSLPPATLVAPAASNDAINRAGLHSRTRAGSAAESRLALRVPPPPSPAVFPPAFFEAQDLMPTTAWSRADAGLAPRAPALLMEIEEAFREHRISLPALRARLHGRGRS